MLICLRHSPSVGPPNVFSSSSSKQQAPARRSGHVVAGFGSALMDGKSPAALLYFVSQCVPKTEGHQFTEPLIPAESVLIGQKVHLGTHLVSQEVKVIQLSFLAPPALLSKNYTENISCVSC